MKQFKFDQLPFSEFTFLLYLLLLVVLIPSSPASSYSTSDSPLIIPHTDQTISWEHIFEEEAWDRNDLLPMIQYQPVYQGELSAASEVRVIHDGSYLYVYGFMHEQSSDNVRVNSLYRNRTSGDDLFSVIIDPFNDNETGLQFQVNPAGVRIDAEISNDAEGRGVVNDDWNTFWDAKARITEEGWEVAMRIPFATLGFQPSKEAIEMGLIVNRLIARNNERHIFPDIPPDWRRGHIKPSQAQTVALENVSTGTPLHITPYATGGVEQFNRMNETTADYQRHSDYPADVGLDVRYPVTSNLTLDLTLNTDFAQVEADPQQLDLDRFDIFLPEKRRFFQERANIFDFDTGGPNSLFYSRRIGLDGDEPVRILGGGRMSGRVGNWDIGMLNMQTERRSDLNLPSENFGVVRLRRDMFNPQSYAGGMITSRTGLDGSYNRAVGLDGRFRVIGDEFFVFNYAQTFDDSIDQDLTNPLDNSLLRLQWNRQRSRGFNYVVTYKRAGDQYQPGMGFERRSDYTMLFTRWGYGYFTDGNSPLRRINPALQTYTVWRNVDGSLESMSLQQPWTWELQDGTTFQVRGRYSVEDLRNPLIFTEDAHIPEGNYHFYGGDIEYEMSEGSLLRTDINIGYGTFYDGTRFSVTAEPTWNISRHLELGGEFETSFIRFPDRDQQLNAYIARFRSLVALNQQLSMQAFIQVDNMNNSFLSNLRLRYNFREGNDLWVVYNESMNTDLDRAAPPLPRMDQRIVLVKYTHTFNM